MTTSPTPEDPRELRLFEGDLSSENLGPAAGAHHLGTIKGPGVYFLVSPNATGKSTHLQMLALLEKRNLLGKENRITDGELHAHIQLGGARITFGRTPAGKNKKPRVEGRDSVPAIEHVPTPIEDLITGGGLVGERPRLQHRLRALLTYSPVDTSAENLAGLAKVLEGRLFATIDEAGRAHVSYWNHNGEENFVDAEVIRDQLCVQMVSEFDEGILEAHKFLLEILNEQGLAGEKLAKDHAAIVANASGALDQIVASVVGGDLDEAQVRKMLQQPTDSELPSQHRAAEEKAAEIRLARRHMLDEEGRRAKLRQSHGERPDVAGPQKAWLQAKTTHEAALDGLEDNRSEVEKLVARLTEAQGNLETAQQNAREKESLQNLQSEAYETAKSAAESWDATAAMLAESIEGPAEGAVDEASDEVEALAARLEAQRQALNYQEKATHLEAARTRQSWIEDMAADFRTAAGDSWDHLGIILTDALGLPWLRVTEGLRIEIGYTPKGQLATGIAFKRSEISKLDWRDLDDSKRISTGELHQAMLQLMLDRRAREADNSILIMPWEIGAALDDKRLIEFSKACEGAGLIVLSERPSRSGDGDELVLEKVGA